ncbi:MAG: hypothetical protein AB1791_03925 [Chloroflexota bacterium]
MQPPKPFTGLGNPVFTAFGWLGEEAARVYAYSQLEQFISALHSSLPREAQSQLPYFGLDKASQAVYLAASEEVEKDGHISFNVRPASLEIALVVSDKKVLERALKTAETEPDVWHRLVTQMGPEWNLHVEQAEYNEGQTTHYQDLFKGPVSQLDPDSAVKLVSRTAYLNNEEQWVTPLTLSRRYPSEQIANMGLLVLKVMGEQITLLMPLFKLFTGQWRKAGGKGKARPLKGRVTAKPGEVEIAPVILPDVEPDKQFTYLAELKPLHIRRGFINLTPQHWPFFALTARSETRPVTIYYEGRYDRHSAVWRLVPNDQARIVLSETVHRWLEDHFGPDDHIQVTATKLDNQEIQLTLTPAERNEE